MLFSILVIFLGAGASLFLQPHLQMHADEGSIIGQPSLPAATVDAIFKRLGSPMFGTGELIERVSRQTNIDDAFALAVWWTETNDGEAGTGSPYSDHNPGGVRESPGYPFDAGAYTIYPSYTAAITDWFRIIRSRYVSRGLTTVYAISHPYVGTSSSPLWAAKVIRLIFQYRGETPPVANNTTTTHKLNVKHKTISKKGTEQPDTGISTLNTSLQHNAHQPQQPQPAPAQQPAGWLRPTLGLLAFLAIVALAIGGMRLRRTRVSPALERTASSWLPGVPAALATDTLSANTSGLLIPHTEPLIYPGNLVGVQFASAHACASTRPDDRETPYTGVRDTDPRIRRVTLLPSQSQSSKLPSTGMLETTPVRPFPSRALPGRTLETVGACPTATGLLSRYRAQDPMRVILSGAKNDTIA